MQTNVDDLRTVVLWQTHYQQNGTIIYIYVLWITPITVYIDSIGTLVFPFLPLSELLVTRPMCHYSEPVHLPVMLCIYLKMKLLLWA